MEKFGWKHNHSILRGRLNRRLNLNRKRYLGGSCCNDSSRRCGRNHCSLLLCSFFDCCSQDIRANSSCVEVGLWLKCTRPCSYLWPEILMMWRLGMLSDHKVMAVFLTHWLVYLLERHARSKIVDIIFCNYSSRLVGFRTKLDHLSKNFASVTETELRNEDSTCIGRTPDFGHQQFYLLFHTFWFPSLIPPWWFLDPSSCVMIAYLRAVAPSCRISKRSFFKALWPSNCRRYQC